jgi:hypothetical protein
VKGGTGCLATLARGLAIVLAVVVVVSLPFALVAYDVGQVVFSKDKMTQIVVDQLGGSGEIRRLVLVSLLSNSASNGSNANDFSLARVAEDLSPERTQELVNLLLPEDWFREQVGTIAGGIYTWLDGDQPQPDLALDLRPLKERLINGGARKLMQLLIDSWPQCLPSQLAQIEQALIANRTPPMLLCKPSGSFQASYVELATSWFTSQVRLMPDKVSLTNQTVDASAMADLATLRDRIRLARDLLRFGWMIPASLLGLIMALAIRSWQGLTRWWGASLAATGVASLLMIPSTRLLESRLLRDLRPSEALPPVLIDALGNAADGIRSAVVRSLAVQAMLLVLLGAGLLVGGWLLSRRSPSTVDVAGPGTAQS